MNNDLYSAITFTVRVLLVPLLVSSLTQLSAQEIHFSQFYNAPFLINPAYSGNTGGKYLLGINYRSQGNSWGSPFVTQSACGDARIYLPFSPSGWFGAGAWVYGDKAGDGALKSNAGLLHLAYTFQFDPEERFLVSLGVSSGYSSVFFDEELIKFEDQWDGTGFGLPSTSDPIVGNSDSYPMVNAGLMCMLNLSGRFDLYAGTSLFYLNSPRLSFYGGDNRIDPRLLVHGGATIGLQENLLLEPAFYYSTQYGTKEIVAGANAAYDFTGLTLLGGLWARFSGDVIPAAGLEYKAFRLLFSYDVNVSRARAATNLKGGFELSLRKVFYGSERKSSTHYYKSRPSHSGKPKRAHSRYDKCRNFEYE